MIAKLFIINITTKIKKKLTYFFLMDITQLTQLDWIVYKKKK